MKKKIVAVLTMTCLLLQGNAQLYNYMGNHVIFNMEGYFSPAWFNPNPVSSSWNVPDAAKRYLGVNYFLSPNVEMMVWERGTVGAGYNYYNSPFTGIDNRVKVNDQYWGPTYVEMPGNIVAHGFNVFYKQYVGANSFAPLGHYFKFAFDGFLYNYNVPLPAGLILNAGETLADYETVLNNKGSLFGLKVEYGYDLVVLRRVKLSLGASVGTTFGGYKAAFTRFKDRLTFSDDRVNLTYDNNVRGRILGAYWFGVKLGVGIIAF